MEVLEQPTTELCLPNWSYQGISSFADRVLEWAGQNSSDFPWRLSRSPYEILVAELLLKRTTATAAARIYEGFLVRFPSLQVVASAPDEELIPSQKPVLRKFQRFSTCERYRMLGSTRNRDCILYPGKGTVVLIRPAQTFYERIKNWLELSLVLDSSTREPVP